MSTNDLDRDRVPRVALVAVLVSACGPATKVSFADGKCVINGEPAPLARVESRQAEVTQHVLSRAPILTAIAIAAVAVAVAGYLQRILTVLAARRADAQSLGDRLRARMERYRAHPVRYFMLLSGVLALLVAAGVAYVAMDADKRTSERALASLQFCHLALRSADEQHVLAEQRDNLASIQSTEGDIRALVNKLPPAEKEKAQEIVDQLSTSLGQQRTMVAHLAQHADVAAKAVAEHQAEVERGLSKLADDVVDLKSMPAALTKLTGDIRDLGTHQDTLGGELEACSAKIETVGKALDAMSKQVDAVANRPACPACSCAPAPAAAPAPPSAQAPASPPTEITGAPHPADAGV